MVYIGLGIVFLASVAAASLLPVVETVRALTAVPAIGSLFAALFQIARDRIAHERSLFILESQNAFSMGATSHMACVAFDRYSSFCEEYVAEVISTLTKLFREGPNRIILQNADNLRTIRNKWAVWLTPNVDEKLASFEKELGTIGMNALINERAPNRGDDQMFLAFAKVIGLKEWQGEPLTNENTGNAVINHLRHVLGTEELSRLRSELVTRALRNIGNST
jgi:hypothetical protein